MSKSEIWHSSKSWSKKTRSEFYIAYHQLTLFSFLRLIMRRILPLARKVHQYIDMYPDTQPEACATGVCCICSHVGFTDRHFCCVPLAWSSQVFWSFRYLITFQKLLRFWIKEIWRATIQVRKSRFYCQEERHVIFHLSFCLCEQLRTRYTSKFGFPDLTFSAVRTTVEFLLLSVCLASKTGWRSFYSEKFQLPLLLIHGELGGIALLTKQREMLRHESVKRHIF